MATPNWLAESEMVIGNQHPLYTNTKDRCGNTIQSMIEVEHSEAGVHTARATGLVGEIDTFAGNGTARTISLSNAGLTPKKVYVWQSAGSEEISNGGFDSDTAGWTARDLGNGVPTLASVAGGPSGNCCEMTSNITGGTAQAFYQTLTGLTIGEWYDISFYVKEGSAACSFYLYFGTTLGGGTGVGIPPGGLTAAPGTWTQYTGICQAAATTMYFHMLTDSLANGETFLTDTVSVKKAGQDITRIDLMTSDKAQPFRYQSEAWEADLIDNETAGSFDVGDTGINTNGVTNYYLVLGVDTDTVPTGDTGAGSDPTWITSSTLNRIIADDTDTQDSGNIANYVESEIWEMLTEEHTVAGAHSVTLQHARVETISWAGNDADDRTISLVIDDLDIDFIEVYYDGSRVFFVTSDMGADETKQEDFAALLTDRIQDITTNGEVEVGTILNTSGNTYVAFVVGT